MTIKVRKTALMLGLLIAVSTQSIATNVGGLISTNTTWTKGNSPYVVTNNILVSSGVILTIDPGVTVKFDASKSMQIDGTLIAQGLSTDSIRFTSNSTQTAGTWGYIYFSDASKDASFDDISGDYLGGNILEYCWVEYAGNSTVSNNGALRLKTNPYINHCTITNNSAPAIRAFGISSNIIKVSNSVISNNSSVEDNAGGIYVSGPKNTCIQNNVITNNKGGGISSTSSFGGYTIISNNIISHNSAYGGGGIGCDGDYHCKKILITNNVIMSNYASGGGGGGISAASIDSLGIVGNLIINNTADYNAGVYGGGYLKNNIIANNISTGTNAGIYCISSGIHEKNLIINNTAQDDVALYTSQYTHAAFRHNTIAFNNNTNVANENDMLVKLFYSQPSFDYNNIFNNSTINTLLLVLNLNDISAINNWWGTTDNTSIQNKIYDWFDDNSLAIVNYNPYLSKPDTAAPVSPPAEVTKENLGNDQVKLTWSRNPESDIKGYQVYYGGFNGYTFTNRIDVSNDTTYTLTGVTIYDTIAVTAYDSTYNEANELPSNIVNDNMVNGNESWYSYASFSSQTGVKAETANSIKIFPNHITNAFQISGIEGTAKVTLSDLSGSLLFSKEIFSNESISVSNLPNGLYLVTIQSNKLRITEKIVIQR